MISDLILTIIFVLLIIWSLFWKGYSVWVASRLGHKRWFIFLLILNTLGIFQIFYIFYIAKKTPEDIKRLLKTKI